MDTMENEPMIVRDEIEDEGSPRSRKTEDLAAFSFKGINRLFVISFILTISLGSVQFGYMIGSWNVTSASFGKRKGWNEYEQTNKIMLV